MRLAPRRAIAAGIVTLFVSAIGAQTPTLAQTPQPPPPAKPRMVEDVFKNVQALRGIVAPQPLAQAHLVAEGDEPRQVLGAQPIEQRLARAHQVLERLTR